MIGESFSDASSRLVHHRMLACEFFLRTGESGKLWQALVEAYNLLGHLDLCHDLLVVASHSEEYFEDRLIWIQNNREQALNMTADIESRLLYAIENRGAIDPAVERFKEEAKCFIEFQLRLNSIYPADRSLMFFDLFPVFRETQNRLGAVALDPLYDKAEEEIKSFKISAAQFRRILRQISFTERSLLQNIGIFRINQEKRHLVFSKSSLRDILPGLYLTPALDAYLFARDLLLATQQGWGRFISFDYNHYIIKFYSEPHYWENRHLFKTEQDFLRLGFAFYQYAMEIGNSNRYSQMIYHKALDAFKAAHVNFPEDLKGKLWGT